MRTKSQNPIDVYQIVTDQIIAKLSHGIIPWKRGYSTQAATNYATGKQYRGINALLLGMAGYQQPYFLTYKQAQALGGHVRKGAKSEIATYYQLRGYDPARNKWFTINNDTVVPAGSKVIPMLKYYRVFNIQDIDGIIFKLEERPTITDDLLLQDLEIGYQPLRDIPNLRLKTNYPEACYQPLLDAICMPGIHDFHKTSGYFKTLYHELIHATGHGDRLAREGITNLIAFGSHRYSKEELIAELGSCFLMTLKGFDNEEQMFNSTAYIQSWLHALKNDKKMIVEAAAEAQKAVDYILEQVEATQKPARDEAA